MLKAKDKIGTLDREVTFIQAVIEDGVSNDDKLTDWEEIENYPRVTARKIEDGGSSIVANDRVTYVRNTTWIIRYRDDLFTIRQEKGIDRMRLVFDTQMYQILNISETGESRKRYLEITTSLIDNEHFT